MIEYTLTLKFFTFRFPFAIKLLESNKAPISKLVSDCFKWSQMEEAFEKALSLANVGNRKVIVKCNEKTN